MPVRGWHVALDAIRSEHLKDVQGGTATGPAAAVTVGAGGEADVNVSISFPTAFGKSPVVVIGSIGPLPAGIVIGDVELTGLTTTGVTVSIRVYNYTAAGVTVGAGSVSVSWIAVQF